MAILRFPQDRLAVLTSSFGIAAADSLEVVGTKGDLWLKPAFDYHEELQLRVKVKDNEKVSKIQRHDQFAPDSNISQTASGKTGNRSHRDGRDWPTSELSKR